MSAKRKATEGTGYLLEAWRPPDHAGVPLACLATTFTFDGAVFEEECLARFLDIQGAPEESGVAYLIEREEKMAAVTAAVLVDAQHARGTRYLRWDLLTARLPRVGAANSILHAKVWLLVWEKAVRLVVGSANLTRQGLRLNHEIFGVLDYREGRPGPANALVTLLGFMRTAAGWAAAGPARQRWLDAVDLAGLKATPWATDRTLDGIGIHALVTQPSSENMLSQLRELLPGAAPDYAEVLSPFFDPPSTANAPARELWKLMARDAEVCFWLTADKARSSADRTFLRAPESLVALPPGRDPDRNEASRCLAVLGDNRPLHAKSLWLERDGRWVMYVIGSHNFTTPGLGIGALSNVEVSLVYVAKDSAARKRLAGPALAHEAISGDVSWLETEVENPEDESTAEVFILPCEFGAAVFHCDESGRFLMLHVEAPRGGWRVTTAEEHGGMMLYDETDWLREGRPPSKRIPWGEPRPPSRLLVYVPDRMPAEWIVELNSPSSLPPPDELAKLPLEALLDVLTSARPLQIALTRWLNGSAGDQHLAAELDPHRRIDTSGFLLQRTGRFSRALAGLKVRLELPIVSPASLDWRLHGPVGVVALADAVQRDAPLEMEAPFLLSELYREFLSIEWRSVPGGLPEVEVRRIAGLMVDILRARLVAIQPSVCEPAMRDYITAVLQS